ncbi:MAG TPA: hypothetical protein EYG73_07215 [Arcobacter sp.]|nr:hypothetical protein [Arcobacter sp.]
MQPVYTGQREHEHMKKILTLAIVTGLLIGLTGCGDNEKNTLEAERKAKREHMKQRINSKSNNAPTKLPL